MYDSGEITDHYAPFSLYDLIMLSLYNKAVSITLVRNLKPSIYSFLSFTPHVPPVLIHAIPTATALGQSPIHLLLEHCVGLFIVLPSSTFCPRDFILCVWPEWHCFKQILYQGPLLKSPLAPTFPKEKLTVFRFFLRLCPHFMCIYPAPPMPCRPRPLVSPAFRAPPNMASIL